MHEIKNPPLGSAEAIDCVLEVGGQSSTVPDVSKHKEFLPPSPLEPLTARDEDPPRDAISAAKTPNPSLGTGLGRSVHNPLLEPSTTDAASQIGELGDVGNPALEPDKDDGEIKNPSLEHGKATGGADADPSEYTPKK